MKKFRYIAMAACATVALGLSSCTGDLDVTPIDPNTVLPQDVLNSQDAFAQLLAKCYQGLASSTSSGESGSADISGVDGGYGQYLRAMFHLECLSTDEAVCCWNDQTLYDIHNLCWSTSDTFVAAAYYRVFYQIGLCNEFIRQAKATDISGFTKKEAYIDEARALRLYSYYNAIDLFGNVPFTTEENSVGSNGPEQISRADLFDWMVTECKDLLAGTGLAEAGKNEYGRIDKGAVQMILAKLYLNAQVWSSSTANYFSECADLCKTLMSEYSLHSTYADLFCADNHLCTKNTTYNGDEIIFAVEQDGNTLRSYGATNYVIFASTGGDMDPATSMGISSGWGGLSLTGTFVDLFTKGDDRAKESDGTSCDPAAMFCTMYGKDLTDDISDFKAGGYKSMKFKNINHDGSAAQASGFVDTDYPIFRVADAYLMLAECAKRGGASESEGLSAINAVRERSHANRLSSYSLQDVLNERGRELYHELVRRQDLIRFGEFTTSDYLWQWKGGVQEGKAVDSHFNLFPIPSGDRNANSNLAQNPGY